MDFDFSTDYPIYWPPFGPSPEPIPFDINSGIIPEELNY